MPLTHKISRSTWYLLAMIYVSMLVGLIGVGLYANHVAQQSSRQWCDVVVTIDDGYKAAPPTTPTGKKLATEMHDLRARFRCKGGVSK